MIDILDYLDYRLFLRDYYEERKRETPAFSYQMVANMAGFQSKGYVANVMCGRRNLSERAVQKFVAALKLGERRAAYFATLVAFNQARSHRQKNMLYSRLMQDHSGTVATILEQDQHSFYSQWYHNTIRELVTILDFGDDYGLLGRRVRPSISARKARESVALMVKLGLIRKEGGRYVQCQRHITTGDALRSMAVEAFHLQNLKLAAESLETIPGSERNISCMVLGLSPKGYERLRNELAAFRRKAQRIAEEDETAQRVYHLALQLFPTSTTIQEPPNDTPHE